VFESEVAVAFRLEMHQNNDIFFHFLNSFLISAYQNDPKTLKNNNNFKQKKS
jgi:hypothetical protein